MVLIAWAMMAALPSLRAGAPTDGRTVYRRMCVKCHGARGEGVKGKYDGALHGDWSLEKLARYIAKNMPEDAPGRCVGPQAESVALYIHDEFYSREARARNHPARVELTRLTNRQYLSTIADLLRSFSDPDPALKAERGLRGDYSNRIAGPDGKKQSFERVEGPVDFDFDAVPAFSATTTNSAKITNEFNINWRGSVIVEETGEYQWAMRTPNGARLWVNDEDTPLIDAGVASGDAVDHTAALKLLGGRAYPIRLEYYKAPKDKKANVSLRWTPPRGSETAIPARNLSPARVSPTFVVAAGFPPDDSSVGYERGVSVSKAWDDAATQAALAVANQVAARLDRFARAKPADTNRAERVAAFCETFASRAFRRPLTADDKKRFVTDLLKASPTLEDGVKRVILISLKSPRFLYPDLHSGPQDGFTIASRLSLGLWDSLPDRELWTFAESSPAAEEKVRSQARRMLNDPRARSKMRQFLHHWLQMDHVEEVSKDARLYPGFSPEIVSDLRASLDLFLEDVVWTPASDYRRLLLEDDLWVNDRLARFYSVERQGPGEFVKVNADPKQRSGVLTHPYLLSAFAYPKASSPIHRGVFLTRNIVGRSLKPPPMAVAFKDADFLPGMTMREKVAELTRPQACQTCHSVINPLGFSLENYDAVGRFRTRDGDRLIDAVSDYTTDDGKVIQFKGARDVAEFAAGSQPAHEAFIEQLFHQIAKQPMAAYGPHTRDQLREGFVKSEFNIQKLVVEIAALTALQGPEPRPAANTESRRR
ncbi:MAG: DUF1592 domain-containing protein [Verrucomicrobia bacterium]|nr:DUF1592 domain-containing protein [Verrucomicrobiota bacterium]MBI3867143.1 DUF1592 domain-containing protein [Verrucomicrobiota bacterium]